MIINRKPINTLINPHGFTLIEVLIALVILAISLTAIVKASSADIENTAYLQNKAIAHLVAYEAQQLIELNAIGFNGNTTEQETKIAGNNWFWTAQKYSTPQKHIKKISVTVYLNHKPITTEESFILDLNS